MSPQGLDSACCGKGAVFSPIVLKLQLETDHYVGAGHGIAGLVLIIHIGEVLSGHEQFSFITAGQPVESVTEFAVDQGVAAHGIIVLDIGLAFL